MANIVTESRLVSGFSRVRLEGTIEATIEQGENEALVLEADADVLPRIKSEVQDGELVIGLKRWLDLLFFPLIHARIRARISLKEFRGLSVSGSGKVSAARLQGERIRLSVSGSADIDIDELLATDLEVQTSGSAEYELAGKVTHQEVRTSGTSRYEAIGLESQTAELRVSGSGRAMLSVQEQLDVTVSGSADIRYRGNPRISQKVSGSASIRKLAGA